MGLIYCSKNWDHMGLGEQISRFNILDISVKFIQSSQPLPDCGSDLQGAAKPIVLLVFYPNNMVPLWA